MAYSLKIKPEQMEKLYYLREERKRNGQKSSIAGMVRDAIARYLKKYGDEVEKGDCLVTERTFKSTELEKEYARKKIEITKSKMNPKKLELVEKLSILTDK